MSTDRIHPEDMCKLLSFVGEPDGMQRMLDAMTFGGFTEEEKQSMILEFRDLEFVRERAAKKKENEGRKKP